MRQNKVLPVLLMLAFGISCKASKSSHAVHVPGEDATIDDYEQMLDQSAAAMAEIGIQMGAAPTGGADMAEDAPAAAAAESEPAGDASGFNGDCKTLCDLSSTTCELEARICVLAARHEGDARYANACTRAGNECELAEGVAESSCECEY